MLHAALLIDSATVSASGGETFERMDPVSHEISTRASAANVEDAERAANAAARAFPAWSQTPPSERRALLNDAADILQRRTGDFVEAMIAETGATAAWGQFNCRLAANILREAGAMASQVTGEVIPADKPGSFAMAVRQACGVVFSMAPWNAPVVLSTRSVAMPLACGNTVVMKGSELCPRTHGLLGEVLNEAGLPKGTVNVIHSSPEKAPDIVEALIAHPAIRRVNFTGSTRVGRMIAEKAARHLKRCLLELGGKAPLIVLDDADIDAAVDAAVFGAFFNQGQICMSTERIVVEESVETRASVEAMWRALTTHEDMPKWFGPVRRVVLDPPGRDERNGLGAIRHIHALGPAVVEEVVEWDPPHRYVYKLLRGAPIRKHRGEVRVEETPRGARASWRIEFAPVIPLSGLVLRPVMVRIARSLLEGAAAYAEG